MWREVCRLGRSAFLQMVDVNLQQLSDLCQKPSPRFLFYKLCLIRPPSPPPPPCSSTLRPPSHLAPLFVKPPRVTPTPQQLFSGGTKWRQVWSSEYSLSLLLRTDQLLKSGFYKTDFNAPNYLNKAIWHLSSESKQRWRSTSEGKQPDLQNKRQLTFLQNHRWDKNWTFFVLQLQLCCVHSAVCELRSGLDTKTTWEDSQAPMRQYHMWASLHCTAVNNSRTQSTHSNLYRTLPLSAYSAKQYLMQA